MTSKLKYFFRSFLIILGFCIIWNSITAQVVNEGLRNDGNFYGKDTLKLQYEPSALFKTEKSGSTSAVSTVPGDILYQTPAANLSNTFYGLFPGLTVLQGSGEPGNDRSFLWIRGSGSYNYCEYAVFVDGFQTTFDYLQYLSASEIENISVLKDAAALAPFGMKGANGVLWIETRRGKPGKPSVNLHARTGFQKALSINKPLGSFDYASLYNEAISNDNGRKWQPFFTESQLQSYKNGTGTNTNWYDEVLKSQVPFTTADATFSGGNQNARYFVMMGYMKDQGLYDVTKDDTHSNAGLRQFNLRTNLDFNMFRFFEGAVDIGGRTEDRSYPNYDGASLWDNLARYPNNIYSPRNANGTWAGNGTYPDNPLASIRELGYTSTHDRTLQANFSLKENLDFITPGLYLKEAVSFSTWTRGSYNVTKNYARFIDGVQQTVDQNTNYSIFDDKGTNQWNWNQFQGQAGYERTFGKHSMTTALNYLQYTRNVDANQNGSAGLNTKYAFRNIGGRIHYEYDERYSAEFGFAFSGSDNFAKDKRTIFYPTLSAAWIVSNETFLKNNSSIDYLKLRLSAGKLGYDDFSGGRYLYQLYYAYTGSYPTGNNTPVWNKGISPAYISNPDISAEQSLKYNIGIDVTLFKRFDLTADIFQDKRSKIITLDNSLMAVFGTTPPYKNIGKVTNRGFEASLAFSDKIGKLNYQLMGRASINENTIDYMAEIPPVTDAAAKTGRSIGTQFGYEALGFYDISDFNADGSLAIGLPIPGFGTVQPGDIRYHDINDDKLIDERDMTKIGEPYMPKFTYSFNTVFSYSGFDLMILLQGVSGRDVNLLDASLQTIAFRNNGNVYDIARGRWAYYPEEGIDTRATASYPRLSTLGNTNNYLNSTFWMKNGAFLRLRNVEIGYSVPESALSKLRISGLRIYFNGVNLLTWSPLLKNYNLDPETITGYPALKSFNFGTTINF
jgi:TonB-linked SusC/RagA family outer membrane protein